MGTESFLKATKYGLFYPFVSLFPLPTAYCLARAWGRREARRNPSITEAVRANARLVLGASASPTMIRNLGEQFFAVRSYDELDAFAVLTHSWRRLEKWIRIEGEENLLPLTRTRQGVLLLTFHVGGGSLIFPYLRSRGLVSHYLSISLPQARAMTDRIQYTFGWFRLWGIQHLAGHNIIFVGGSKDQIRQVLRQGGIVVALLDVVPDALHIKDIAEVSFFGRLARFPTGLLAVAAETDAAVVPFFGRVEEDLHRHLSFAEPQHIGPIGKSLDALVGLLEEYIRRYPQEWHFWPGLQYFYGQEGR